MFISVEDKDKLEIVKDYSPRELQIIINFYEEGMFCDRYGQPYTREYMQNLIDRFGVNNA